MKNIKLLSQNGIAKIRITTLACLALCALPAAAQQAKVFQIGVGLAPHYTIGEVDFFDDDALSESVPHVIIGTDMVVLEDVGPGQIYSGGFMGYSQYGYKDFEGFHLNFINVGARGGYALYPLANEKIVPYGGISLFYSYVFLSGEEDEVVGYGSDSDFKFSFHLGGRLVLAKRFGLFAEIDPLYTVFKGGIYFGPY